tara:strand:+ start:866 stop:1066 length:201 start_codon:yes stop_codon:yes gene_type:complete
MFGILLVFLHFYLNPKPPKIVYRYLPKSIEQEHLDANSVNDVFKSMFDENGNTWIEMTNEQKVNEQ